MSGGDQVLDDWLSEEQVAAQLKHHEQTLRRWRASGIGPRFTQVGRQFFYRLDDVRVWLAAGGIAAPKPQRSARARKQARR